VTDRELLQQALDAERRFDKFLGEFDDDTQERILRYALDHFVPNMKSRRLAQLEPEPFEYWNAVEGWVKIDEVRQHFDTAGCGTIYKTAGEGRVPLYVAREWQGLTDEEIGEIADDEGYGYMDVARAIQAKLKEKNGF